MNKTVWQIAALYAASALGVAYVGGAEWLRFFSFHGTWGLIGVVLATFGLTWFTAKTMRLALRHGVTSLGSFLTFVIGKKAAPSVTFLLYLLVLVYAGLSVGETALIQADHGLLAFFIMAAICAAALLLLRAGQARRSTVALLLYLIALLTLVLLYALQPLVTLPSLAYQLNANWLLYACFYIAFHYVFLLVILFGQLDEWTDPASLQKGIWCGGFLLFLLVILGNLTLLAHWHEAHASSQPLLLILSLFMKGGAYGGWGHALLQQVLLLAFWLYGLAAPLARKYELRLSPLCLLFTVASLLFAFLPSISAWYSMIHYAITTYCGLTLLFLFLWKTRK